MRETKPTNENHLPVTVFFSTEVISINESICEMLDANNRSARLMVIRKINCRLNVFLRKKVTHNV